MKRRSRAARLARLGALAWVASCLDSTAPAPRTVATLAISPFTATIGVGDTLRLTATPRDAEGAAVPGRAVVWASGAPQVATVSVDGLVTGMADGAVTITATSEGAHGQALVTVGDPPPTPPTLVLSNAVLPPQGSPALLGALGSAYASSDEAGDSVAFVSLIPGAAPSGVTATVQSPAAGQSLTALVSNGGFDPVPIGARVGDSIRVVVQDDQGAVVIEAWMVVAAARRPIVVRTEPPPRKRDVPLNAPIVVVFSEPVAAPTVTTSSVQVLQGAEPVSGTVRLIGGTGLVARFEPSASLAPNTDYRIVVTPDVSDLGGDPLDTSVDVAFTTGTTTVGPTASVTLVPTSTGGTGVCGSDGGSWYSAPDSLGVTVSCDGRITWQVQLAARVSDAQGNLIEGRPVVWSTTDAAVAAVSTDGFAQGSRRGRATIAATVDGHSDTYVVTMGPLGPLMSVEPASATIGVGDALALSAVLRDALGSTSHAPGTTWRECGGDGVSRVVISYASASVAVVIGAAPGTTGVCARAWPYATGAVITIGTASTAPVASVSVSPAGVTISTGDVRDISATLRDASGNVLPARIVTWVTSDTAVAIVSTTGLPAGAAQVIGVGAGLATITATVEGRSGTLQLTVAPASNLADTWAYTEVLTNGWAQVCRDTGSFGFAQNGPAFMGTAERVGNCISMTWFDGWVDPPGSLHPVQNGVAAGSSIGFQVLLDRPACSLTAYSGALSGDPPDRMSGTVTCGWWSGTWEARRRPPVASVALDPGDDTLVLGAGQQYLAVARAGDGLRLVGRPGEWASANPAVATVSPAGFVTAVGTGSTALTATIEGHSDTVAVAVEVVTFANVAAGSYHTCALTQGAAAYCWGYDGSGQLGEGATNGPFGSDTVTIGRLVPTRVAGGVRFQFVTGGWYHTCGLTPADEAYCWGSNYQGELGNGSGTIRRAPVPVLGGMTFRDLSAGVYYTCALTASGAAYCWGGADGGGVVTTPTPVAEGLAFAALNVAGGYACGLTAGGAAHCWYGYAPADSILGGITFSTIAAGGAKPCGATPDGVAYCWGRSDRTPVPLAGGARFTALTGGGAHTCGLSTSGAAYCWGDNSEGQLGNGSTLGTSDPVVAAGGLTFTALSAGAHHTCGTAIDGAVYCWGLNGNGQLGDGSKTNRTVPVKVAGQP